MLTKNKKNNINKKLKYQAQRTIQSKSFAETFNKAKDEEKLQHTIEVSPIQEDEKLNDAIRHSENTLENILSNEESMIKMNLSD